MMDHEGGYCVAATDDVGGCGGVSYVRVLHQVGVAVVAGFRVAAPRAYDEVAVEVGKEDIQHRYC